MLFLSLCTFLLRRCSTLLNGSLPRKHSRENLVDVRELPPQVEGPLDLRPRHSSTNLRIVHDQLVEVEILLPCLHGVTLYQPISVLAGNSALDQVQQQLPA